MEVTMEVTHPFHVSKKQNVFLAILKEFLQKKV
jgi:hypothetical protein